MEPTRALRIMVPVSGAYFGQIRVRRATGTLDTDGLERVLSEPSARALTLARQLHEHGAELVAVHVDRGAGEEILREALAHGADHGILVEGLKAGPGDASARAALIADVVRENGPFDAIVGAAQSELSGFTGTLPYLAGQLEMPVVVGVRTVRPENGGFRIGYESIFGTYDLQIPSPCVVVAGDLKPGHPTAWAIHDAFGPRGILRVQADAATARKPLTKRLRVESPPVDQRAGEEVDGATLVRRMRSRALIPERRPAR